MRRSRLTAGRGSKGGRPSSWAKACAWLNHLCTGTQRSSLLSLSYPQGARIRAATAACPRARAWPTLHAVPCRAVHASDRIGAATLARPLTPMASPRQAAGGGGARQSCLCARPPSHDWSTLSTQQLLLAATLRCRLCLGTPNTRPCLGKGGLPRPLRSARLLWARRPPRCSAGDPPPLE